ncbi:hypothetical protein F8388_021068 [Cannabis sativa]|uniref:Uncharacterized protein n=1 Tax=Cannabis sativa TaxID=3483 RepID=A0A7J6GZX7_CANSA|nr:hypothetical protein F8388_021068 [Cannabis sativa]
MGDYSSQPGPEFDVKFGNHINKVVTGLQDLKHIYRACVTWVKMLEDQLRRGCNTNAIQAQKICELKLAEEAEIG